MLNKVPLPKLVLVNSKNHNHFSWLRLATVSTGFESAAGFFRCFRRLHLFFHGCQGHCRDINRYNHQKGPIAAFWVILRTSLALDPEWQVLLLIRKNTGAWEIEAQWVRVFCLVARTLLRWSSSLRTLDTGKNVFKFVWSYFNISSSAIFLFKIPLESWWKYSCIWNKITLDFWQNYLTDSSSHLFHVIFQ